MSGKAKRYQLRLKHSAEMVDVQLALVDLRNLRFFGKTQERLQALADLAEGCSERVSPEVLRDARKIGLLMDDEDSLPPQKRAVFLSALQRSPEGLLLLNNPFILESKEEKLIAERAQRRNDRAFKRNRGLDDSCLIDEQEFRSL